MNQKGTKIYEFRKKRKKKKRRGENPGGDTSAAAASCLDYSCVLDKQLPCLIQKKEKGE